MFHEDPDERRNFYRRMGIATSIPIAMAAGPAVGYYIGTWLDGRAHTSFLVYVFLAFGFGAGVKVIVDMVKRLG